jgi:hypothetical protein
VEIQAWDNVPGLDDLILFTKYLFHACIVQDIAVAAGNKMMNVLLSIVMKLLVKYCVCFRVIKKKSSSFVLLLEI